MRLLRRMPAVSTNRTGPSSVSTTVSMVSLVVPGRSWTTARRSPIRRLNRVDLPTLGRPTMATMGLGMSRRAADLGQGSRGRQGAQGDGDAARIHALQAEAGRDLRLKRQRVLPGALAAQV